MSEAAALPAEEWRRTSPLSFVVSAITGLKNLLFPMAAVLFGSQGWDGGWMFTVPSIAAMIGFSALFTWIAWRHFRYRIGDSDIRVERGLLSRTARSVPYERIQDVSLEQKLVPRLFGMVDVKFETGAGGNEEVRIRYVTAAEADALRETVRAHKSGEAVQAGQPVAATPAEEPARTLFAMDSKRLLTFGLFEFSMVVFAVLGGAAQQFDFMLPFEIWDPRAWMQLLAGPGDWLQQLGFAAQVIGAALALAVLAVVGLITGLGRTVLRDYGFRLEETPKGLRRRRGLLTRTDAVMPIHRVQALKVTTGFVRRRFGWHGLSVVSLAQDAKSGNHVVVPFARIEEIEPVIETTDFRLPGEATEWRRASLRRRDDGVALTAAIFAVLAAGTAWFLGRFAPSPEIAVLAPAGLVLVGCFCAVREWHLWRHRRHALDSRQIYVRHGWLAQRLEIGSRLKLQSIEIAQGPLAQRRGYASVKFGVAGGSLEIDGVPFAEARAIRNAVLDSIAGVDFSRLGDAH